MPRIDLSFEGWLVGVDITTAMDQFGNDVDVSILGSDELAKKLQTGELLLSFESALQNCDDSSIELHDFDASK